MWSQVLVQDLPVGRAARLTAVQINHSINKGADSFKLLTSRLSARFVTFQEVISGFVSPTNVPTCTLLTCSSAMVSWFYHLKRVGAGWQIFAWIKSQTTIKRPQVQVRLPRCSSLQRVLALLDSFANHTSTGGVTYSGGDSCFWVLMWFKVTRLHETIQPSFNLLRGKVRSRDSVRCIGKWGYQVFWAPAKCACSRFGGLW